MDEGLTSHSGCPVYEGEKKIVTQWVRYGVDAQNPWTDLNTRKYQVLCATLDRMIPVLASSSQRDCRRGVVGVKVSETET